MESKPWYLSKTVIGLATAALGLVLSHWNVSFTADAETNSAVADAIGGVVTALGLCLAAYGRVKANTTLTLKK